MSDERILAQVGTLARPARVWSPQVVAYEYRARTYPWALRNIAAAEAKHGAPGPKLRPSRPCKCGCGQDVPAVTGAGRQADYADGHRPREAGKPGLRPALDDKLRCKGCGYLTTRCSCPGGAR